jgi:osmotically-inducible protein OsmY
MHHTKTLLAATLLAIGLSACASGPGERQGAGDYFHDSGITTKVKTAFIRDPDIHSMDIHVETINGKVQLTGHADTQKEIDRAAELAASVSGVEGVKNDIQLKEKEKAAVTEVGKP